MKRLLAGVWLCFVAACLPPASTTVAVSWGPNPWYTYCTWDAPCWYSGQTVFIYGWGYVERPTYVYLLANPGRREGWAHRRRAWYPGKRPEYRGQDYDTFKQRRDAEHRDKEHHHRDHDDHGRRDQ